MQCGWRNGGGGRKAGRREGWQTDWHQEDIVVAGWCPREGEGANLAQRRNGPNIVGGEGVGGTQ